MAWLIAFLCFLGLEAACRCLVSLWFCAGCLGAWLGGLAGVDLEGQLALFVAVSFLTLILLRPAADRPGLPAGPEAGRKNVHKMSRKAHPAPRLCAPLRSWEPLSPLGKPRARTAFS